MLASPSFSREHVLPSEAQPVYSPAKRLLRGAACQVLRMALREKGGAQASGKIMDSGCDRLGFKSCSYHFIMHDLGHYI